MNIEVHIKKRNPVVYAPEGRKKEVQLKIKKIKQIIVSIIVKSKLFIGIGNRDF